MILLVAFSLVIGLLLGLLGGGGSVLTVPVLVYLVGVETKTAIATSLVVVGVTSVTAMLNHARAGRVCWKTGAIFGAAGMLGAYLGGRLAAFIPGGILLLLFAAIMLGTAVAMLTGKRGEADGRTMNGPVCPQHLPILAILFDGLLVGALTGLVGAGGGFLVVPALNLLGGLPMHAAVGTSLLVIAMKSFAALAGYVSHVHIDIELVGIVTGAAVVGSLLGGLMSKRVSGTALRRVFAVFVILVAAYLLYKELTWELLLDAKAIVSAHPDFFWGLLTAAGLMILYWLRSWLHVQGHTRDEMN